MDSERNNKENGEMAQKLPRELSYSVIQFLKDGLSSHRQTAHRTRGSKCPEILFRVSRDCPGKPQPRSLSPGKRVMWAESGTGRGPKPSPGAEMGDKILAAAPG